LSLGALHQFSDKGQEAFIYDRQTKAALDESRAAHAFSG